MMMHPVDEYAQIKDEIAALEARRDVLRAGFLARGEPHRSNWNEIVVTVRTAKFLQKDRLPAEVLSDPHMYVTRETRTVCVRPIMGRRPQRRVTQDDIILIE